MSPPKMPSSPSPDQVSQHYTSALRLHLNKRGRGTPIGARTLAGEALGLGMPASDLERMHRNATRSLREDPRLDGRRTESLLRSFAFCTAVRVAYDCGRSAARDAQARARRHSTSLALEAARRKTGETKLRVGNEKYLRLLRESASMQAKLRQLARQVLSAQEDERREISRELHDEVVQTLVGINVELATLGKTASRGAQSLRSTIARSQRLLENSVNLVHRFARKLRPAVLDDIGLISAIHAFCKEVSDRKSLRIEIKACAEADMLDSAMRTVLYRVAQEALVNVVRHARATKVLLTIRRVDGWICMDVHDNGISFPVEQTMAGNKSRRLGLIGMRERLEMVGGGLAIESAPQQGTTIRARVPAEGGQPFR
jgi:two-component system, NarL family, sensor histidine kinase DegS